MVLLNSVVVVLISNFILYLTYRLIEFRWPEYYFSPNDKTSILFSQTLFRYSLFRVLPLVLLLLAILGIVQKSNILILDPALLGLTIGLIFGVINDAKAIYRIIKKTDGIKIYRNHVLQITVHLITIFVLSLTGYISGVISRNTAYYILLPDVQGVVDNLWSSFFTVLIIFIGIKLRRHLIIEVNLEDVIKNSSRGISENNLKLIENECIIHKADETLVKAIAIAENIERPSWFRKVEYILSFFGYRGSYGIMQVKSDHPISDDDSIRQAIKYYFSDSKNKPREEFVRKYNNDDNFLMFVEEIIKYITP